jgi:hypothetical protein
VVEQVVLFKVRDEGDVPAFEEALSDLDWVAAFAGFVSVSAGPLAANSDGLTHGTVTRWTDRGALAAWVAHPKHELFVRSVAPLVADTRVVDIDVRTSVLADPAGAARS